MSVYKPEYNPQTKECSSSIVTPDSLLESEQAVWDEVGSCLGPG